ncbi:MAG: biopolymer transporter ExbD [Burkholderiaceae bacterium]
MATQFSGSMRGGRRRKFKSEINVVPYIDVMLVLLVIFMVAAPITNPGVIDLPTAAKSNLPPSEYIEIALKADTTATIAVRGPGRSSASDTVGGRAGLLQKLEQLHAEQPTLPLMISANKDIKYDEVIKTISDAKKIGIDRVGLATATR